MTMPARRASKFCAKRRALSPELFCQSLIPQAIPGFCEPWSECQPEESRPPEGRPEDSSIYIYRGSITLAANLRIPNTEPPGGRHGRTLFALNLGADAAAWRVTSQRCLLPYHRTYLPTSTRYAVTTPWPLAPSTCSSAKSPVFQSR